MNVYIYIKRGYEDFHALSRRKNKANSKPNKANCRSLAGNPKQDELGSNERANSMICRMRFEKTKPISKRLKLMQLFIEQGIMAKNELSGGEKTKPIKANLPTPKGVDRRLDDDCIRDIVVCGKEIWYKAYVARSTGIFR